MPSGDIYDKLVSLIFQFSERYSTPNFKPHVTLLGPIVGSRERIVDKTSQLANCIQPYEIRLTTVDYLDEYFRCLFLRVKETKEVISTNDRTREIFSKYIISRQQDEKYMPHLRLLYGDFSSQTKKEIIQEIGREFDISFKVGSIHLFVTQDEVRDWYRIKEFNLK